MNDLNYKNPIYLEYLAWGLLLALIVLPIIYYAQLPDQIPSHFNAKGEADTFSHKTSIWVMPIIGTAVFLFLHFLSNAKSMNVHYYPKHISKAGEAHRELLGRKLLNALKIVIPAAFLYITYRTILIGLGDAKGLGTYFIYVFLAAVFGVIIYFMVQMSRGPK